ncbi:hypothetical protein Dhaf_0525 [Desulfitobacterium hafniense DCB-2]|uniref:Uncharacterized protein n=1 Tax=Desulfitobacterium hafniense (strain DSM 10664 / DCB-2) TaxID=272564 RepID=B8FUU6_DESHD|nr:hypothetical protein Dhaf_0525 [Desulfitobacterium hafniense DCB-2]
MRSPCLETPLGRYQSLPGEEERIAQCSEPNERWRTLFILSKNYQERIAV